MSPPALARQTLACQEMRRKHRWIESAPSLGWYRVVVTQFAGAAIEADTVMMYGRYPPGNSNCNNPTPPLAGSVPGLVDADELSEAEKKIE